MSDGALSEHDRLIIELHFWRGLIRTSAFRTIRNQARKGHSPDEHVDIPYGVPGGGERERALSALRLPDDMGRRLAQLLGSPASAKGSLRPNDTGAIGDWTRPTVLRVEFAIEYENYPTSPEALGVARTLTEAKNKAANQARQIVQKQWDALALPQRDRARQARVLERAGRWLADYYVGKKTYASIAAGQKNCSRETVQKAVQFAATALGINLRRRPPTRPSR